MVNQNEEDIRWLRAKLAETKDESERKYILKQLQLLEAQELAENQSFLTE